VVTDFDARAADWDEDPAKVRRAAAVADAIRSRVPLTPSTRLLEYGAGTGLVTQRLAANVGAVTLADPSAGMRAVIERKVRAGELPRNARIWDLDLAEAPAPDDPVDLLVTVMTLHHISDLEPVLCGFAELLVDGGYLCIADLELEDGSFHASDPDFDGHDGFAQDELRALLEAAGFTAVRSARCHEIQRGSRIYPVFLTTCRRAPAEQVLSAPHPKAPERPAGET
jgi:predicted TPR repeat methyltransferase